jgi:hypothetical protein
LVETGAAGWAVATTARLAAGLAAADLAGAARTGALAGADLAGALDGALAALLEGVTRAALAPGGLPDFAGWPLLAADRLLPLAAVM